MADRDRFGGRSLPTETIREDIGFQGPHSDFNNYVAPFDDEVTISDIPSAYDNRWQQGYFSDPDFGPAGGPPEITDVPSAYDNRWQQGYFSNPHFGPAGGPQGIETLSPQTFPGLGNLPVSQPWATEFKTGMMDDDMMDDIMLAKIYQSGDPGMINKGSKWNFMPGGDPLWDEVSPQGEAINTVLEMPIIQQMITEGGFNYEDFMRVIPESLRRELPRDAFQSKSDFMNQQPITVI
jgi:hypothetical protein